MKKTIVNLALMFIMAQNIAFAGMGACHDGSGNVTALQIDAHPTIGDQANCEYYSLPPTTQTQFDRIRTVIKTVPRKYIKWQNEPKEMNQSEKDAFDQAEADRAETAKLESIEKLEVSINDVIVALVKRINVRIPNNPITRSEITAQIREDKGLN